MFQLKKINASRFSLGNFTRAIECYFEFEKVTISETSISGSELVFFQNMRERHMGQSIQEWTKSSTDFTWSILEYFVPYTAFSNVVVFLLTLRRLVVFLGVLII